MLKFVSIAFLLPLFLSAASAQNMSFPRGDVMQAWTSVDAIQNGQMNFTIFTINSQNPNNTSLQSPSGSVSALDLKAPKKARKEYVAGYQLLMKKDFQGAVEHLTAATSIYPKFVAAHNALGTAFMELQQNEKARDEFAKAVELDDHLPSSHLNMGIALLNLKQNAQAEESLRKASAIAPLDLQLSLTYAYAAFANHDYPVVISTMEDVHKRKHDRANLVHFFAAGAYDAQQNLAAAQEQMETLLQEDPNSSVKGEYQVILDHIKTEESIQEEVKRHPPVKAVFTFDAANAPTADEATRHAQQMLQDVKERSQIAEAEAAANTSPQPGMGPAAPQPNADSSVARAKAAFPGTIIHSSADEVAIFFSATDHGKSVMDLQLSDVGLKDDSRAPAVIRSFRNESQLPLRLGLVIDTSDSVKSRLSFEQAAAIKFLHAVMTDDRDLNFVIGVNNSVLLVQDFTSDQALTTKAVNMLAPSGGTALWDAVKFATEKLASRPEPDPVARMLVVISDGEDNSSSATLKEAIATASSRQVAIYTVSTRELTDDQSSSLVGEHALKTLSDLTGGATFTPGSARHLSGSLADVQQIIRGRYMLSYKPASFERDGRYRAIEIQANKGGHPLKIYARKGYYASSGDAASAQP